MPSWVTKTIRLVPSQERAVTRAPALDSDGQTRLAELPSGFSTTIALVPSAWETARATYRPSGDTATAVDGRPLSATGAWSAGK